MANLSELTTDQLRRAVAIKEQIEALQSELNSLTGEAAPRRGRPPGTSRVGRPPGSGRRTMSAAARAAIAAAQRARWAKQKNEARAGKSSANGRKGKRKMSAAAKARISAAAKARWAKAKASGKNKL